MSSIEMNEFDDFPLSPMGSTSAAELYGSFLQSVELAKNLPKRELGQQPQSTFYALMQEVHAARRAAPALYRKRVDADEAFVRLWLSRVRQTAQFFAISNDLPKFDGLDSRVLSDIARLSVDIQNLPKLANILCDLGIILIYERAIPGIKLDGAAFALADGRPVIGLSLRYSRLDIFWFSLLHELAHVALHYDKLMVPIIDNVDEESDDIVEQQADRLARDSLISRSSWRSAKVKYSMREDALIDFARQEGVHPSIVVGRLRRELNRHDIFSDILSKVDVRKILLDNNE